MKQIGRKLYYELSTGNVVLDTGEREGSVVETSIDEDFYTYTELQPYVLENVGVIQLQFGDFYDKFLNFNPRINLSTTEILWDVKE